MKPILRSLLVIDGIITLLLGLALIVSPWADSIVALQAIAPHPPALGQLFGISLLGIAWLQLHAAVDGQLTLTIARVSGHVNWLSGLVLLVWLIVLHGTAVDTSQAVLLSGPAIAFVLLVLGVGLVRLAGSIRRRNRQLALGTESADKAERSAREVREREREREAERAGRMREPTFARPGATPVRPPIDPATGGSVDPATGHPVRAAVDPVTGLPVGTGGDAATRRPVGTNVDPLTGASQRTVIDPVTGEARVVRSTSPRTPSLPEDDIRRPL
ncbi:hypothetical protein [Pararobbsia alpina]|uniref:Uncharacterized protein n=1 Tax=Pararobbsia alpina TaxID=621374 RepID=A0A6S7BC72_9BURK|nr:hypothetical protein [Pararobbsia alpina]CAB3795067.1 hypothetical protein LMG28138_03806 [Pararobbsia alpina]